MLFLLELFAWVRLNFVKMDNPMMKILLAVSLSTTTRPQAHG